MTLDPGSTIAVITIGTTFIGGIVTLLKTWMVKQAPWEKEFKEIKTLIEAHISDNKLEFSQVEAKLKLLEFDSEKIEEIKRYVDRVEGSIERETSKLEQKIDDLMKVVIENMRK